MGIYAFALGTLDAGSNYTLELAAGNTFEITPKTLTITGITATDRAFEDGNTTVAITEGILQGVLPNDTVTPVIPATGSIEYPTAGEYIAVTIGEITLNGTHALNYVLTQPTGITVNIAQAPPPDITWPAAADITYGDLLSDSELSGGSVKYGSFEWTNGAYMPNVPGGNFSVTFTPSASTVQNFEPITTLEQDVVVIVNGGTTTGADQLVHVLQNNPQAIDFDLEDLLPNLPADQTFNGVTFTTESVTNAGGVLASKPDGTVTSPLTLSIADVSGAGLTAAITVAVTSGNFYNFTAVITVETTAKIPVSITADVPGGVYNGNPHGFTNAVITNTVTGQPVTGITLAALFESTDGGGYSGANPPINAGAYRLTLSVPADNPNYVGYAVFNFTITPGGQAAPTGLSAADETAESVNDGTITGVTTAMEWQAENGTWADVTGNTITELAPRHIPCAL